ncbi:MAG TPA: hypothetical protein VKY27_08220 [Bacteriovoracaceae bacterium]|nr:hypothetical protein [Bacteriovoracaceae bacterium]
MLKLLILLLLFSCSSYKAKKNREFADQKVSNFVSYWKKENSQVDDRDYKKLYSKYLDSVEKIFVKEGMTENIDFYLESLKQIDKNLEKGTKNYQELYSETDPSTKKTRVITELYDSLIEERSDKLLDYYGFNFYSKLMKNRNKFVKKEKSDFNFPL